MADFEEFLITEFNEQHSNMRQIESSMTQIIQGFFTVEGVILAGALGLFSISTTAEQIILFMAPIFWFLFLFGHLTYNIAIYSFVSILIIDFQNTVARKYFGKKYGKEAYLYFMLNPEVNSGGKLREWEKIRDNRSATAKFVGTVNAVNLILALVTSAYVIAKLANPQLYLLTLLASINPLLGVGGFVIILAIIQTFYHRVMFLRIVRQDEAITLKRRQALLKQISQDEALSKPASVLANGMIKHLHG